MWKFHIDESNNGIYDMIPGRDLLTALRMDLKFSDNVISGVEGLYEVCSAPMVDISSCGFNLIMDKTVKPE